MSIPQSTTIQAYQLLKGGTPARMAILRMIAADSVNNRNPSTRLHPGDWRGARSWTLKNYACTYVHGLHAAADGTWYTHGGEYFRNERDACDVVRFNHSGYYTDVHQDGLAIGIVASLPHGRFIAGYRWTDNDERVWYPTVFDDEEDAARMADEHARVFGEAQLEDNERYETAREIESETEDALTRLRECLALRHQAGMAYVREEARELVETIRNNRTRLTVEFADYVL